MSLCWHKAGSCENLNMGKGFNAVAMKSLLRKWAEKRGIEIRKAPFKYDPLPVFDFAISYLLCRRGPRLTFIEVGANDGQMGDPLRQYILRYPWTGILIEPQPDMFGRLRDGYATVADRLHFENVAISGAAEEIAMFRARFENSFASTVASSNPDVTARQTGVRTGDLERIVVPATTLDRIIAKYHLFDLDILQIDTEGLDWEVLQTLNLNQCRPRMIRFEHGHLAAETIGEAAHYLNTHDYWLYYGGWESDSIAMPRDLLRG